MDTTAKLQTPAPADDLEKIPVEQVLRKLTVKTDLGLSKADAAQRLIKYGPNAFVEKEVSWARKILGPFTGPIAYMIEAAAIVSAILHRWQDFVIIAVLLLFNAGLELWQDLKASNALAALKKGPRRKRRRCGTENGRPLTRRLLYRATSSKSAWA